MAVGPLGDDCPVASSGDTRIWPWCAVLCRCARSDSRRRHCRPRHRVDPLLGEWTIAPSTTGAPRVDVKQAGEPQGPELVAEVLRERIYGTIACLSTLLVLVGHLDAETSAWAAFVNVAVTNGSLWAASLLADVVAHITAHGRVPRGAEAGRTFSSSGQILQACAVPLLLLLIAGLGGMSLRAALQAGIWVSVVTLGLFALLAGRRAGLPWWKRVTLVATLVALGVIVVALKTLAHA